MSNETMTLLKQFREAQSSGTFVMYCINNILYSHIAVISFLWVYSKCEAKNMIFVVFSEKIGEGLIVLTVHDLNMTDVSVL
jgi:hypothetical protein